MAVQLLAAADPDVELLTALAAEELAQLASFVPVLCEKVTVDSTSKGASGSILSLLHRVVQMSETPAALKETAAWCLQRMRTVRPNRLCGCCPLVPPCLQASACVPEFVRVLAPATAASGFGGRNRC